eukprot:TRINITY_DN18782_c0_g1_i1.p1 TRINITY_DN18782_c0_g1~~TRINITY_DN18782_c0_g1_i1.p1  ORF type:complete len:362 (-),score=66.29 TRINITY_DN18782_c0_g1_i1:134-1144(-)
MATRFNLKQLLAACVHLSRRGGRIIKEVAASGELGAHNKKLLGDVRAVSAMEGNEVLTVADGRAQDAIVTSLKEMFPTLRLVGEEGEVPGEEAATALEEVKEFGHDFEVPKALEESLTSEDTCLWIDPLDGTKEFVLKNHQNVTVLIGVCVRDRPVAGVIFQPFVDSPEKEGTLTYGAIGAGVFGDRQPAFGAPPAEADLKEGIIIVTNQKGVDCPRFQAVFEHLAARGPRPRVVVSNASGNKLLRVLRGEVHAYINGPGPSRWDSCAGEALLLACGGKATNLEGIPYEYIEGGCYDNSEGLIAARTEAIHKEIADAFAACPAQTSDGPASKKAKV